MESTSKIVKNVRIVRLADVPPAFMLRPKVIEAIRREVLHDLQKGLNRVPSGVEADFITAPSLFRRAWLRVFQKVVDHRATDMATVEVLGQTSRAFITIVYYANWNKAIFIAGKRITRSWIS